MSTEDAVLVGLHHVTIKDILLIPNLPHHLAYRLIHAHMHIPVHVYMKNEGSNLSKQLGTGKL